MTFLRVDRHIQRTVESRRSQRIRLISSLLVPTRERGNARPDARHPDRSLVPLGSSGTAAGTAARTWMQGRCEVGEVSQTVAVSGVGHDGAEIVG